MTTRGVAATWILTTALAAACTPGGLPTGEGAADALPTAGTEAAEAGDAMEATEALPTAAAAATDVQDGTYLVDGRSITLVDGLSELETAPGAASKLVTRYFGNGVELDLDGDGALDQAFLLQQEGGGSGTFFYVVAAMGTAEGYRGTNAIFLGDRIAPQSTHPAGDDPSQFIVNYADRNPGEPMSARPSVGVSRRFAVRGGELVEVGAGE